MNQIRPIRTHIGLGDTIIQAGLFVELYKREGLIAIPAYYKYAHSVRSIFKNYPQIEVYTLPHEDGWDFGSPPDTAYDVCQSWTGYDTKNEIRLGVYHSDIGEDFTKSYYRQAGIDYNKRWDSDPIPIAACHYDRQWEWLPGINRNFLHDDPKRGYNITKLINRDNCAIAGGNYPMTSSILSYFDIIRTARKICVIDSCFFHLVESLYKDLNPECDLQIHQYQ